jgi:hypothetical protein
MTYLKLLPLHKTHTHAHAHLQHLGLACVQSVISPSQGGISRHCASTQTEKTQALPLEANAHPSVCANLR